MPFNPPLPDGGWRSLPLGFAKSTVDVGAPSLMPGAPFKPFFGLSGMTSSLNDGEHPEVLFQATQYRAIGLTQAGYALPSASGTPAFIWRTFN